MRPASSYTTTPYRVREYSQSPIREPVCQNPPRRQNASIDHRVTRDYYDSVRDTDRSYYSQKTDKAYPDAQDYSRKDATVVRRYDTSRPTSYSRGYNTGVRHDNSAVQTPVKGVPLADRQRSGVKDRAPKDSGEKPSGKVLFIDVENKVEEEVLMELYMRICGLSMENERQRHKNADLLKNQNVLLNILSIKDTSLNNAESAKRSYQAQIADLNHRINSITREHQSKQIQTEELSSYKHRTGELENKVKLLASENERLSELKRNHEKEIAVMKQEFIEENKKLSEANERVKVILEDNEKLKSLNQGLTEELEHKDEYLNDELTSYENYIADTKQSYESKLTHLSSLLKTKERENEGLKEELSTVKQKSEQKAVEFSTKEKQVDNQVTAYETKIAELKSTLRTLEQDSSTQLDAIKADNEGLRKQLLKLQSELQKKEETEALNAQKLEQLKSKLNGYETENQRLNSIVKEKIDSNESEAARLLKLTEELRSQLEEKEKELQHKQNEYSTKINEFADRISAADNETAVKAEEVTKLESALNSLQLENQTLKDDCESLKASVERYKRDIQRQEPELAEKIKEAQKSQEAERQSIVSTYERQINELTTKCNRLIEERAEVSKEYSQYKLRMDNEVAELRDENYKLTQTRSFKQASEDQETVKRINELQTKLNHTEETLYYKTNEITELTETIERLNEKVINTGIDRNTLDKRVGEVKREYTMQIGVLENKLAIQTDKYNKLKDQYDEEIQKYETKIKELNESIASLEMQGKSERKRATQDTLMKQQELNRDLLTLKDENSKLKEIRDTYKNQLESLREEYNKLEEKYRVELRQSHQSKEEDHLRQKLDSLLLKSTQYENSLETQKAENLKLKSRLKEIQQRHSTVITEFQNSLEQAESTHRQYKAEAEQERYRLTSELDAVQNEAQRLRNKINRIEETNNNLLAKQRGLMEQLESAEGGELSKRTRQLDLQAKLDAAKRSLDQEKKQFEADKRELVEKYEAMLKRTKEESLRREEQLVEDYRVLKNKYNELQIEMDNTASDKQKLQRMVDQLDSSGISENMAAENAELKKQLELLERDYRELQEEFNQADQLYRKEFCHSEEIYINQINDYKDRIEALEEEVQLYRHTQNLNTTSLKERSAEYESHFQTLNKQLEKLEERYQELQTEHSQLQSKHEVSTSKNKELERTIENYKDQTEMLNKHLKENEQEISRLQHEFQRNIGAISSWQTNKDDITQENMELRLLCDDRLREIEELAERRDDALIRIFQLSVLNQALLNK